MLPECWKIKNCGREPGGPKSAELGVCPAATQRLGHSCWLLAGTLCGGVVQGTFAQKEQNCLACDVYLRYNRTLGSLGAEVTKQHPDEEARYRKLLVQRLT